VPVGESGPREDSTERWADFVSTAGRLFLNFSKKGSRGVEGWSRRAVSIELMEFLDEPKVGLGVDLAESFIEESLGEWGVDGE
jgi:hypothetical protein